MSHPFRLMRTLLCQQEGLELILFREDTHKKKFFFSGRATKGVGRVKPTDH